VPADDLRKLITELQHAYSGELAAGYAYRGHWKSVRDEAERSRIRQIEDEEWHHRRLVGGMLQQLGARPLKLREAVFFTIGRVLGALCHVSGWFLPMYGAGKLESRNILEYERAARYASASGHEDLIECLLDMAEVEWDHEAYFRERVNGHGLLRMFPLWPAPPPRESIRERYVGAGFSRPVVR
jgi:demethoxyubiquinone hydroxylase (CLK1/Coq7/Cat5 family)